MASGFYGNGLKGLMNGGIDLDTDTIKVALTTAAYTPNNDTDTNFSDVTNEVSGTGYSTGGATLTTPTITVDTANNRVYLDGDDTSWAASTITNARYAIIYKSTGVAATSKLVAFVDLGGNLSTGSSTFLIQWNAPASGAVAYIAY